MANPVQQADEPAVAPPAPAALNFKLVLQEMVRRNASDLHLKVGRPPTIRVDGELEALEQAPLKPEDLWASVYHHLGIDPSTSFPDRSGRPIPLLPGGSPIPELLPRA